MRKLFVNNIHNFIVISDVHLSNPKDNITRLFINTLENILLRHKQNNETVDALFLLGDIFDFIGVSKQFFYDLWWDVFFVLKKLKESGVSVYFIEGNHDFGFEHFPSKELDNHFAAYGDFIVELEHKVAGHIVLSHGDQIICPPLYLKFRALVKSKWFQKTTNLFFSGSFMHSLLSNFAKKSRSQEQYRALSRSFLESCLNQYLDDYFTENKRKINTLILGHIHILIDECVKETRILIGPDWPSRPSYLRCDASGEFHRVFIDTLP